MARTCLRCGDQRHGSSDDCVMQAFGPPAPGPLSHKIVVHLMFNNAFTGSFRFIQASCHASCTVTPLVPPLKGVRLVCTCPAGTNTSFLPN